jgi:ADP-ribose pyrophosphatase YjhB (NUDIX family)
VPVTVLRGALRHAAEETSYRHVAREVGLSARAVQLFVEGDSSPRARTLSRVRNWYLRRAAGDTSDTSRETAAAAIFVLLGDLPSPHRESTAAAMLDLIESIYREQRAAPPRWLHELRSSEDPGTQSDAA